MASITLENPVVDADQGVRSVNFFNGRLLSANDLSREQQARRTVDGWLGRAIGDGIVHGLQVAQDAASTKANPLVTIEAGLAINRRGQALQLAAKATVELVRKSRQSAIAAATFGHCANLQTGVYIAGTEGIYLLTIAPAAANEGKAPTSGLDTFGGKCNTDAAVETVQFRLVSLEAAFGGVDRSNENRLRNFAAYRCFGADALGGIAADPFSTPVVRYGALDTASIDLTECDVPLALVYWTLGGGIRFIDMWSVRRRTTRPSADPRWPILTADRRRAESEAMFLQFQAHVDDLVASGSSLKTAAATDLFRWLPPAGFLPIADTAGTPGFDVKKFFGDLGSAEVTTMDGDSLGQLVHESFEAQPIDLSAKSRVQLYSIWENVQARSAGQARHSAVVFASGRLRYHGVARFGHASWARSRFAPRVI